MIAGDLAANNCGMGVELFHKIDGSFHPEDLSLLKASVPYSDISTVIKLYKKEGIFGFKMNYVQLVAFIDYFSSTGALGNVGANEIRDVFTRTFPNLRIILVRRADALAQAISLLKAKITGQWDSVAQSADAQSDSPSQWLRDAIITHLAEVQREQLFLERAVSALGLPTTVVTYEDYVEARQEMLRNLIEFVHSDNAGSILSSEKRMNVLLDERFSRQRTEQNENWERLISKFMMSRSYLDYMS